MQMLLSTPHPFAHVAPLVTRYAPWLLRANPLVALSALGLATPRSPSLLLQDIWDAILRAVPKKKTSHMKKRHRQMAGKALKDVTEIVNCPGCGGKKRAHVVCYYCMGAHITDIFSLAATATHLLSASGASSIQVHATSAPDYPLVQTLTGAHKLGCHHIVTSADGRKAASVGFGGELKLWRLAAEGADVDPTAPEARWMEDGTVKDGDKPGEVWALALSRDGQYLASTTYDGRINVWDTSRERVKIRGYETKGSFGLCVHLLEQSADGRLTASGHENGAVYIFNNDTGRMLHSLPNLLKPVRTIAFSPASKLVAAAGDGRVIALYDSYGGEQVAHLTGHSAWITAVSWSHTGQYLLSGAFDGKIKVWSIETRACVATLTEASHHHHHHSSSTIWAVTWLPKTTTTTTATGRFGGSEAFAVAGAGRAISLYREATGG
ncbi:MAG: hypothetical protein M1826_006509 [Phylliscum demangeonii]|nr:MAG: hypothetical protein M1826_006509 [Phylliscum demangeonii]